MYSIRLYFAALGYFCSIGWFDFYLIIHIRIPMMSNNGNAIVSKPANTSPNSTIGRNTMKNTSFVIPHAALIPNNSNLPNIHIIQIKNSNSNNTISPFFLSKIVKLK